MNEELQKVLADAIKKMGGAIEEGVDFAMSQAPDIIQQAMRWYAVTSGIRFALAVIALASLYPINRKLYQCAEKDSWVAEDYYLGMTFISLFVLAISSVVIAASLDWLKIWVAPKLWLIEYAASFVK